jgi:hypothetical protein
MPAQPRHLLPAMPKMKSAVVLPAVTLSHEDAKRLFLEKASLLDMKKEN